MATYSSAITQTGVRNHLTLVSATLNVLASLDPSSQQDSYMDVHLSMYYGGGGQVAATYVVQSWDATANTWRQVVTYTATNVFATPVAPVTFSTQTEIDNYIGSGRGLSAFRLLETYSAGKNLIPPIRLYAGERLVTTPSVVSTVVLAYNTLTFKPAS